MALHSISLELYWPEGVSAAVSDQHKSLLRMMAAQNVEQVFAMPTLESRWSQMKTRTSKVSHKCL